MKKLLLTSALVATVSLAYGQGTVALSNGATTRLSSGATTAGPLTVLPFAQAGYVQYSFWYGATAGSLQQLATVGVNSTTGGGLIAAADGVTPLSLVGIPTFDVNSQPFMQITARTSDGLWSGATPVIQVGALGAVTGPATALWQSNTGTNPNRFKPNQLILTPVPEPTALALAGLGVASLLIFRRRK